MVAEEEEAVKLSDDDVLTMFEVREEVDEECDRAGAEEQVEDDEGCVKAAHEEEAATDWTETAWEHEDAKDDTAGGIDGVNSHMVPRILL